MSIFLGIIGAVFVYYLYLCTIEVYGVPYLLNERVLMIYALTTLMLFIALYLYFPIAEKYHLLAGVNNRSSHKKPVITAAGFIFFLSYLVYFVSCLCGQGKVPWLWMLGLTMLAAVSFADDLHDLWYLPRLGVQVLATACLLMQIAVDAPISMQTSAVQWLAACTLLVLAIMLINLYNFMDGLNGMLACMSLSMLIPAWCVNRWVVRYMPDELFYFTLIPTLIFFFFNFRAQPKCFSGDVGSIVLGYVMVYIVFLLLVKTGNAVYILLFGVVLVEAGLTVLQRLFAGKNIFKPHRIHLFQLFCNEFYKSHRTVSLFYGFIQFSVGMLIFAMEYAEVSRVVQNLLMWSIFAVLCVIYLLSKRKKMGGHLLTFTEASELESLPAHKAEGVVVHRTHET